MAGAIDNRFAHAIDMANAQTAKMVKPASIAKAKATAQDFEAAFLSSMFQHMFTGTDGDGPMGGTTGIGPWRSFLTQEFGKSMAAKGGIGLADQVYKSLISHQAAAAAITKPAVKTQ
jgi:Rod binding domain-containing protein